MFGFFGLHIIRHAFARSITRGVLILWRPPPAAMQVELDQSHQQWVSRVKLRMPRRISEIDEQEEVPLVECRHGRLRKDGTRPTRRPWGAQTARLFGVWGQAFGGTEEAVRNLLWRCTCAPCGASMCMYSLCAVSSLYIGAHVSDHTDGGPYFLLSHPEPAG